MVLIRTFFLLSVLAVASPATADWKPVGNAEMHVLFWHAYDSKLSAQNGIFDAQKPYALENTYRMDFSKEDLIDRTFEEMKRHGEFAAKEEALWRKKLSELWPDVKENDRIRAYISPGKFVSFRVNGNKTGRIVDAKFATLFPAIWLGENTSEPAMRKQLLGKK
jgi:hypothetical protein